MRRFVPLFALGVLTLAMAVDALAQARGRAHARPLLIASAAGRPVVGPAVAVSSYPIPASGRAGRLEIRSSGPGPYSVGQGEWQPQDAPAPSPADWPWRRVDLRLLVNEVSARQTE